MSLCLGLSDLFLMVKLESWILGKNATEMKCLSHQIILRDTEDQCIINSDVNIDRLVKVMLASFLCCKVIIFLFPSSII